MAYPINGKNVLLSAHNGIDGYYPIACSQTISMTSTTGMLPTATPDSGSFAVYMPDGLTSSVIEFGGIMFLRDLASTKFHYANIYAKQVANVAMLLKITFTDQEGFVMNLTCSAFVPSTSFSSTVGGLVKHAATFQVSGAVSLDVVGTVGSCDIFSDDYSTTEGQTSITQAALVNKTILQVWREGLQHDEVSGAPVGRQFKYTVGTGNIAFDPLIPFNPGETIHVLWKPI